MNPCFTTTHHSKSCGSFIDRLLLHWHRGLCTFSRHSADSVCVDVYLNVASPSGCAEWDLFNSKRPTENLTCLMECFLKKTKKKNTGFVWRMLLERAQRKHLERGGGFKKKKKVKDEWKNLLSYSIQANQISSQSLQPVSNNTQTG